MKTALINLQNAVEEDKLYDFLIGENGYSINCQYADVPTDVAIVMDLIKEYEKSKLGTEIWKKLENALLKMSQDKIFSWFSLYYLMSYLIYARSRKEDLIDLNKLLNSIKTGLTINRSYLMIEKKWGGSSWNDGLWGDVNRLLNNISEEFGVKILD